MLTVLSLVCSVLNGKKKLLFILSLVDSAAQAHNIFSKIMHPTFLAFIRFLSYKPVTAGLPHPQTI